MDIYNLIGEATEYDKKQKLEKKRPKSWCKSISAFANGLGGVLIFGISDGDRVIGLETLVNALIHRNYLEVGSEVHVDLFDDRIEIFSPGGMVDGSKVQNMDLMNISSRRRNPVIADIFNRLRFMDRRGSGFKKILGDYKIQLKYSENKVPKFYSDNNSFLLVLKNLNYKKVAIKSGDKEVTIRTQEKYAIILNNMIFDVEYKLEELIILLDVKKSRMKNILNELNTLGKIEIIGSNKNRRYKLK